MPVTVGGRGHVLSQTPLLERGAHSLTSTLMLQIREIRLPFRTDENVRDGDKVQQVELS